MIKTVYVCEHCGIEMPKPIFTLNLRTEDFSVQLRGEWHFCKTCWPKVRDYLSEGGTVIHVNKNFLAAECCGQNG